MKVLFLLLSVLFVVSCGISYMPSTSNSISYYKGNWEVDFKDLKYDLIVHYDGAIQYKKNTDFSYITLSKSEISNKDRNWFYFPIVNSPDKKETNYFELIFSNNSRGSANIYKTMNDIKNKNPFKKDGKAIRK